MASAATLINAAVYGLNAQGATTGTVWDTDPSNPTYTLFVQYPVSGLNGAPVLNPNDQTISQNVGSGPSPFLLAGEGFLPGTNQDSDLIYRLTLGFLGGASLTGTYTPTTNTFLAGSSAVIDGLNYTLNDFSFRRFGGDTVQIHSATPGGDPNDYVGNFTLGTTGAVPEPATWAMMLIGFGMLGFTMRRRNRDGVKARVRYA
ncbi:PEPxxWA-CTERM sorting domain-containing protein [Novosphingobium sp. Gsoil 351]|nr:PEPxxWA-CTERM sorting domain-containing protein [Novosphingobium sp. Gsoil 351]